MTRLEIKLWSPEPLVNTLPTWSMVHIYIYIYIYIYIEREREGRERERDGG